MDGRRPPPETSNFYCLPGRAGGSPISLVKEAELRTWRWYSWLLNNSDRLHTAVSFNYDILLERAVWRTVAPADAAQPVTSPVPGELLAGGRSSPLGIKMGLNRGTKQILYSAHAKTRKSFGEMTRKLSDTLSQ